MSLASRAFKILCSQYLDVLLRKKTRRHAKAQRRLAAAWAGCGDHFSSFERLEPRVLFTAVTSVNPLEGSHDALVATNISATFDEAIDNATVSDQTFVVHGQQFGRLLTINGDITSLGATGMAVTLDPASDFHPGELVQTTVTSGIASTTATNVTPFVWQFRTAPTSGSGVFDDSGQSLGNQVSNDVTLGDLDGDGDLDAFVVNRDQGNRVWLNDGSGNFSDSNQSLGDHDSRSVALGDLDGDGDLDAFVTNRDQDDRVWLNDGSGNFSDSNQSLGDHDSRGGVSLGDLDGDGDLDAFVANSSAQGNRVWLNDGSGDFSDSGQSLGDHASRSVMLGDLDGDGDLDAFVAIVGKGNRVWRNDGSGNFTDSNQSLGDHYSFGVSLGDVDGDGDLDAFVANGAFVNQSNRVWRNDGSGNFTNSQILGNDPSASVTLGDVDGDGDLDAFVADYGQGNRVWHGDGSGNFTDSSQSLGNRGSYSVTLGDVDGDGDLDAFVANFGQDNRVWLNQNAATVEGRHIFYNNSKFDGQNTAANVDDHAAIASDKVALSAGETASFANYTSFSRGINGIMVDLEGAADASLISATDFAFRVSTDGVVWRDVVPAPTSVTTLPVVVDGKNLDRVTIVWDDNEIENKWLEVTVAANSATTGLTSPDVFYFGNAIGETGDDPANANVDVRDVIAVRANATGIGVVAALENPHDLNRDGHVNLFDLLVARNNGVAGQDALQLITAPGIAPSSAPDVSHESFFNLVSAASSIEDEQSFVARGVVLASTWSQALNKLDRLFRSRGVLSEIHGEELSGQSTILIDLLSELLPGDTPV